MTGRKISPQSGLDKGALQAAMTRDGQWLMPLVGLVEQAEVAVDELIDVMGRITIQAVLELSAQEVAGPKQQGKLRSTGGVQWHGTQGGLVELSDRKLRVKRPRLRQGRREVAIPAYQAMVSGRLSERMLGILLNGVSTRNYRAVVPEMADTVGISRSAVSRHVIEASAEALERLAARDFRHLDLLVIYLDGIQFGNYHVLVAVGVDAGGRKHVLGLREAASENTSVATSLLEDLVSRGVGLDRRRLFVIDGSKALRKAINQVYGRQALVQRCRNHKLRNILGHLPKESHDQIRSAFRAANKLDAAEGTGRLKQLARWLERDHPSAAASLTEGIEELFTVNRLGLPASLRRCLSNTNLIDATHTGGRHRTRRITNWQSGTMALRWAAAAFLETEKNYRRIMGYRDLWMLKAQLREATDSVDEVRKAG